MLIDGIEWRRTSPPPWSAFAAVVKGHAVEATRSHWGDWFALVNGAVVGTRPTMRAAARKAVGDLPGLP